MTKGIIHSTESFGSVDGPGIRFIIFLQGCPMRCRFCHNPDTWATNAGTEKTAEELLDMAERYRTYWGDKGGITVSGGEALLQIDFLIELFREAKSRNITTCLDTSAAIFTRRAPFFTKFAELMSLTDTVLLDIKHIDNDRHRWLTGSPNTHILDCARYLSEINKPVWIRHVLIPGFTDSDEYLRPLAAFISTLKNIERIEVLPYHTLGVQKYQKLGIPYPLEGIQPPTRESVEHAERVLRGDY